MSKQNNFLENKINKFLSKPANFYIKNILKRNKKFDFSKPVVLFGAAKMGLIYKDLCVKNNIIILAFCDNDISKINTKLRGVSIISPKEIFKKYGCDVQILITSIFVKKIKKQLENIGFKNIWDFMFFSTIFSEKFDVLVYKNNLRTIEKNKIKIKKCFNYLQDEVSKKVFLETLEFRLNLKKEDFKIITNNEKEYFDDSVYNLTEKEIFVDGGAFDGDTVKNFIEKTDNKFTKICCFEPDNKSYLALKSLANNLKDKRIKIFKYGLGTEKKKVFFTNDGSLGSKVIDVGSEKINVLSIDSLDNINPTLIKFDIEGSEINALLGAKKTILEKKPKLVVCVYHKLEHLWKVILLIKKINPNYKIYIRHYSKFLFDIVCYAI